MILTALSFVVKLSFHGWSGKLILSLLAAGAVIVSEDMALNQSKTQIADWLATPDLMLDLAVLLTVDVFFQISFCVLMSSEVAGERLRRIGRALLELTKWVPGLLIFPVLFALLVQMIFAFPGTDFGTITLATAGGVLVAAMVLSWIAGEALPEADLRLELIFLLNALIAVLGVVATVNGRTAAVGTNSVAWDSLAGVFGLLVAGAAIGFIKFNRKKYTNQ